MSNENDIIRPYDPLCMGYSTSLRVNITRMRHNKMEIFFCSCFFWFIHICRLMVESRRLVERFVTTVEWCKDEQALGHSGSLGSSWISRSFFDMKVLISVEKTVVLSKSGTGSLHTRIDDQNDGADTYFK